MKLEVTVLKGIIASAGQHRYERAPVKRDSRVLLATAEAFSSCLCCNCEKAEIECLGKQSFYVLPRL